MVISQIDDKVLYIHRQKSWPINGEHGGIANPERWEEGVPCYFVLIYDEGFGARRWIQILDATVPREILVDEVHVIKPEVNPVDEKEACRTGYLTNCGVSIASASVPGVYLAATSSVHHFIIFKDNNWIGYRYDLQGDGKWINRRYDEGEFDELKAKLPKTIVINPPRGSHSQAFNKSPEGRQIKRESRERNMGNEPREYTRNQSKYRDGRFKTGMI